LKLIDGKSEVIVCQCFNSRGNAWNTCDIKWRV